MTFILPKKDLNANLKRWSANYTVYIPQKVEQYSQFQPYTEDAEICLGDPHNTRYPPKALFLPQSETLLKYNRVLQELETPIIPESARIVFGIRPCDAQAITLLDTVFAAEDNPDPFWKQRRENTVLVGLGCSTPPSTCFCTTVNGGPFNTAGLDALLTDLGDVYAVETLTEKGRALFQNLPLSSEAQDSMVAHTQQHAVDAMTPAFETAGLKDHLDQIFETEIWEEFAQSCLGCGICTFLCPTCFCFDIVDEVQRGARVRNWDTCMFRIYSQEASGHNPRPTCKERTRQRIMHKYSYWLDHIDQIGCTGCGRCVRYCPVGLDIRAMLRKAGIYESEVVDANS